MAGDGKEPKKKGLVLSSNQLAEINNKAGGNQMGVTSNKSSLYLAPEQLEGINENVKKKAGGSGSSPTESTSTSTLLEDNNRQPVNITGNPSIIQDKSDFLDRDIDLSQAFRLSTPTVGSDQDKFSLKNLSITDREGHDLSNNQSLRNNQRQLIKSDSNALKKYHEQRIAELNDEIKKNDQQKSSLVPRTGDDLADAALMESGNFTKEIDDKINQLNTYKRDLKNSVAQRVISLELPKYDLTKVSPIDLGRKVIEVADPDFDMRLKEAESGGRGLPGVIKADLERFGITTAKQYLENNPNIPDRDKALSYLNSYEADFDERNFEQTWSRVKDKLGSFFYRQGGFNSGGTFGYSKDALLNAINDPDINLSPSEKKVALNYGIPLEQKIIGTDIPGSGFFRSFKNAVEKSNAGIGNTFLSAIGARTDADRAYELLNAETGGSRFANVGNNARGTAALANLNTIEKTRALTPEEQKQKKDLENYVDVRNWGTKFLDGVGDLTGQVGVMALLSTATGGIGRGLMAAGDLSAAGVTASTVGQALSNPSVGLFLSGYLNSYDNYKKQAVELIPNPEQSAARNSYAATMAAVEGLSERIFNEAQLVRNLTGGISPTVANITRRLSSGTITNQVARDEFEGALKNYLTKFGKGYFRSTAQESTEEAVVDIAQGISDSVFGGKDFDAYKTGKQAVTTFLTTALYSPVVAGLAAHGNYRQQTSQNQLLRSSILDMAANPTEYLRSVEQLQLNGEITQQEANDKIKLINSAKNYLQELPETRPIQQQVNENGEEQTIEAPRGFDAPEMTSYILHRMNEGIINEQLSNSTDEVQKRQLEKELKRSQDIREGIYTGTIGVSPEIQEVTANPEQAAELGILPAEEASDEQLIGTPFERSQSGTVEQNPTIENTQSNAEAAPVQERSPQDLTIEELRSLPFANESDVGQRALDQLNTIDFEDTDNIRDNLASVLAITENKPIPDNKLEQVLRGKSKLIGNEDFFTRDYLEKYILFSTKDFSNINTNQNESQEQISNSGEIQGQRQSAESSTGESNQEGDVIPPQEGAENVDTPITDTAPPSDITEVSEPAPIANDVQVGQKVNFGGKEWDVVEDRGETVRISDPETNSVTSIPKQEALSRLVPSQTNTEGGQNATQESTGSEQESSTESSQPERERAIPSEQQQAQEQTAEPGTDTSDSVRGSEAEEQTVEEKSSPTGERQFTQQIRRDKTILKPSKKEIEKTLNYARQTNAMSLDEANRIIAQLGEDAAYDLVVNDTNLKPAVRVVMGQILIKRYNDLAKNAETESERNDYIDKTIATADFVTKKLATEPGQMIQAFSLYSRLTPEGQLRLANKEARQNSETNKKKQRSKIDKIGDELTDANQSTANEIAENIDNVIEPAQRKLQERGKSNIQKARQRRENLLKNRPKNGGNLYSTVGLTSEGIEFVGNLAATYVQEGFGQLEIIADKIIQDLKNITSKEPTSQVKNDINDIVTSKLYDIQAKLLKKGLSDFEKNISKALKTYKNLSDIPAEVRSEIINRFVQEANIPRDEMQSFIDEASEEFDNIVSRKKRTKPGLSEEQLIKRGLRGLEADISRIIKEHYTITEEQKTSLMDKFMDQLGLNEEDATLLAKEIEEEFDRIATRKKKEILLKNKRRFDAIQNGLKGAKKVTKESLQDKIIKYSNLGAFNNAELADLISSELGVGSLTPEQNDKLVELAKKVQNAPEGSPKNEATQDLLAYRANLPGTNWGEVAQGVWYANILSGYATHIRNIVSTFFNSMAFAATESLANPMAIPYIVMGGAKGAFTRGLSEAIHTIKTGRSPIHVAKVEVPSVLERKRFVGGYFNPANYLKFVGRLMVAEDVLQFQGLKESRATQLAYREAAKQGYRNPFSRETYKKVNELLLNTRERYDTAEQQANDENLKGAEKKRRIYEIMENSRPIQMTEDAYGFAARGTFNHETEGSLGALTNAVKPLLDVDIRGVKPVRFLIPFTNIITNVANTALDFTPVGFVRGIRGERGFESFKSNSKTKNAYVELTNEQRKQTIVKAALGTSLSLALYAMSKIKPDDEEEPLIEITGGGTGNFNKDAQLRLSGWQPYSIKIGDKYYSYKLTPLMLSLAWFGNMSDREKYDDNFDEETALKRVMMSVWQSAQVVSDMTFIGSASDFLKSLAAGSPKELVTGVEKTLSNSAKSLVVPNLYTQIAQKYESIQNIPQKQVNDVWDNFIQDIPIARNSLNDKINALGDPVVRDPDIAVSSETKDPVFKFLLNKKGWVTPLNKNSVIIYDSSIGQERKITDDEYYELSKLRGGKIKAALKDIMNNGLDGKSASELTTNDIKREIKSISARASKEAKQQLFSEK